MKERIFVENNKRAEQLQFLRFMAFSLICLHHLSEWTWDFFPKAEGAYEAVSFFFMLSGFVLVYSSYDKTIEFSNTSFRQHFCKRLKKVYPLYFATTMLAALMSDIPGLLCEHNFVDLKIELIQLVKNIFLVQSWFKDGFFSFNGVGWFLSDLLFLSLLDLPIIFVGNKIKEKKRNTFVFVIIMAVVFITLFAYSFYFRENNRKFMLYIFPVGRMWEYIIGACLAYILKTNENKKKTLLSIVIFTIAETLSIAFVFLLFYHKMDTWKTYTIKWVVPNILVLAVFGVGKGYISKLFRLKILNTLGDVSFECFLIHQLIISSFAGIYGYQTLGGLGNIFVISMLFVSTITFALLLHGKGFCNK